MRNRRPQTRGRPKLSEALTAEQNERLRVLLRATMDRLTLSQGEVATRLGEDPQHICTFLSRRTGTFRTTGLRIVRLAGHNPADYGLEPVLPPLLLAALTAVYDPDLDAAEDRAAVCVMLDTMRDDDVAELVQLSPAVLQGLVRTWLDTAARRRAQSKPLTPLTAMLPLCGAFEAPRVEVRRAIANDTAPRAQCA